MTETKYRVFIVACNVPGVAASSNGDRPRVEKLYDEEELNGLLDSGWMVDRVDPMTAGPQPTPGAGFASLLILRKEHRAGPAFVSEVNE